MARLPVASDTFDSAISASWTNGPGDWVAEQWATGGHVEPSAASFSAGCCIRRDAETFANDHYSTITVQTHQSLDTSLAAIGAIVRFPTGAGNEACYAGVCYSETNLLSHGYQISEYNNSFGESTLGTGGTDHDLSAGHTVTVEAEGTTIRLITDEGAGEVERVSVTDATLTSGKVGALAGKGSGTLSDCQFTAWVGGDIGDYEIAATSVALSLQTHGATVNAESNVLAGTVALGLATLQASTSLGTEISAGTEALVLATHAATVNAETSVQADAAALALATFGATVGVTVEVEADTAELFLSTYDAVVVGSRAPALRVNGVEIPLIQIGGARTVNRRKGVSRRMYDGGYKVTPQLTYQVSTFRTPSLDRTTAGAIKDELRSSGPQSFTGFALSQSALARSLEWSPGEATDDEALTFEVWEREP